jgi:hypothetical protein
MEGVMIDVSLIVFATCIAVLGVVFVAIGVLGAVAACRWWRDQWRDARAVIEQTQEELSVEPVPYWPEAAMFTALCNPCQGRQSGVQVCICTVPCTGGVLCLGGFTPDDVRFLLEAEAEGTEQ